MFPPNPIKLAGRSCAANPISDNQRPHYHIGVLHNISNIWAAGPGSVLNTGTALQKYLIANTNGLQREWKNWILYLYNDLYRTKEGIIIFCGGREWGTSETILQQNFSRNCCNREMLGVQDFTFHNSTVFFYWKQLRHFCHAKLIFVKQNRADLCPACCWAMIVIRPSPPPRLQLGNDGNGCNGLPTNKQPRQRRTSLLRGLQLSPGDCTALATLQHYNISALQHCYFSRAKP